MDKKELCTGCQICIAECYVGAISMEEGNKDIDQIIWNKVDKYVYIIDNIVL